MIIATSYHTYILYFLCLLVDIILARFWKSIFRAVINVVDNDYGKKSRRLMESVLMEQDGTSFCEIMLVASTNYKGCWEVLFYTQRHFVVCVDYLMLLL